jgi:hypothetical protein
MLNLCNLHIISNKLFSPARKA